MGTRDYSSILASPAALYYLRDWDASQHADAGKSIVQQLHAGSASVKETNGHADGAGAASSQAGGAGGAEQAGLEACGAEDYNRKGILAASAMLSEAWGTGEAQVRLSLFLSLYVCRQLTSLCPPTTNLSLFALN